ncbi:invasin, partial [Salmonella enterica]|nr:invasin [Salmonella enterica]
SLRLSGWNAAAQSEKYVITAARPDQSQSLIARDRDTYVSGTDMLITVTLKDSNRKPLTGNAGLLTDTTVTVPNAALKAGSSWKDNGDGTYTATYTAGTMSTDNQATLKLSGWNDSSTSEKYAITLEDEPPASINTHVDAYTFTTTSEEGTFPTTGFTGATFTIVPKDSKSATDFIWKSDTSWVSVKDGVVTFTGTGSGSKVTITGTPTSGQGKIIKYSFTLKSWFLRNGSERDNWASANAYCSSQSGYNLPEVHQLTGNSNFESGKRGHIGGLWSEWGDIHDYGHGSYNVVWTSDKINGTSHYAVGLIDGDVRVYSDSSPVVFMMCRKNL